MEFGEFKFKEVDMIIHQREFGYGPNYEAAGTDHE